MAKDFIPTREADFDSWPKFLIQYVDEKCGGNRPEWTHIPPEVRVKEGHQMPPRYPAPGSGPW